MNERCPCLDQPELYAEDSICRTCPWRLVAAVLAGREVYMRRRDYIDAVVAALNGEKNADIVQAIGRNYGISERLAKLALRRAVRAWKVRKLREKTG